MTVKQLRDWLIKQDETATIRVKSYGIEGEHFTEDFYLRAISTVFSQEEHQP
jgi:hypothetical protein